LQICWFVVILFYSITLALSYIIGVCVYVRLSHIMKIKKSYKKLYFTPLPWTDFYQIWKKNVPLVDVINLTNRVSICSRVSILQGVKVSIFPIGNWRRRYNSVALPRSLWLLTYLLMPYGIANIPCYFCRV